MPCSLTLRSVFSFALYLVQAEGLKTGSLIIVHLQCSIRDMLEPEERIAKIDYNTFITTL